MTYRGMRHGPAAVMERLNRGDTVDPSEYYFRTVGCVRNRGGEVRLAEPHHRSRHRTASAGRAGVRRIRGAVRWRPSASSASATWARRWRPIWSRPGIASSATTSMRARCRRWPPAGGQAADECGGGGARRRRRHHHAARGRARARGVAASGWTDRGGEGRHAAADRLLHDRRGERAGRERGGARRRASRCSTHRCPAASAARRRHADLHGRRQ